MTDTKRDQRSFDIVQQYLPGLILNTILEIIKEMVDPYQARLGCSSRESPNRTVIGGSSTVVF